MFRIDGFIVADESTASLYEWFGYQAVCPERLDKWLASDDPDRTLYINSFGGDVFAGSRMYTALKMHGEVDVVVDGLAASAASYVMLGGKSVKISPTAQVMIHNVSQYEEGDYRAMEHAAEELKLANQSIINAYMLKTGLEPKILAKYMDDETWFDAKKAKELNFVDDILFDDSKRLMSASLRPPNVAELQARRDKMEDKGKVNDEDKGEAKSLFLLQLKNNVYRRNELCGKQN